jgi:hypothetical protein
MLDRLISKNEKILEEKFRIKPELTSYKTYNNKDWLNFCNSRNSSNKAEGIFLPRTLSANVLKDSEYFETNFNHEYFGHGFFCEYSLTGKELVQKEKELESLEKKILNLDKLPKNKKISIDDTNPYFDIYASKKNELTAFVNNNLYLYEGFAIWMEYFLAKQNSDLEIFNKKFDNLDIYLKKSFENMKTFEENYGEHA